MLPLNLHLFLQTQPGGSVGPLKHYLFTFEVTCTRMLVHIGSTDKRTNNFYGCYLLSEGLYDKRVTHSCQSARQCCFFRVNKWIVYPWNTSLHLSGDKWGQMVLRSFFLLSAWFLSFLSNFPFCVPPLTPTWPESYEQYKSAAFTEHRLMAEVCWISLFIVYWLQA